MASPETKVNELMQRIQLLRTKFQEGVITPLLNRPHPLLQRVETALDSRIEKQTSQNNSEETAVESPKLAACPACEASIPITSKFCPECGVELLKSRENVANPLEK